MCGFTPSHKMIFLVLCGIIAAAMFYLYVFAGQPRLWKDTTNALFIAAGIFWLIAVPVWLKQAWRPRVAAISGLAGLLVILPTWAALLLMREVGPLLLLSLMAIVWVADIAAYFAGKRFGKTKLAPGVSPGKTWEGLVGGLIGVMAYFLIWYAAVYYFGSQFGAGVGVYWARALLQFGLLMPLVFLVLGAVSVIGDLFESWMKRGAGLKDSSNLLPGHGGILDRIDALTSTLPIAGLILFVLPKP